MRKVRLALTSFALLLQFCVPFESANAAPNWTLIYQTTTSYRINPDGTYLGGRDISYTSGFGRGGTAVTSFANSGAAWDRIRVRLEARLASNSTSYYTDVYFDKWAGATLASLEIPDITNGNSQQRNVTNLVVTSDYSGVKTGSFALGRLEWWPTNYGQASAAGMSPSNSLNTYDWDDSFTPGSGDHGSFQVHNLTDTQTVLAWNMHRATGTQEIGMGNAASGSHPDWTGISGFFTNYGFKVQIFVGLALTTGTVSAPSFTGPLKKGISTTLTSTANGPGRITFLFQGKRIPNCINRSLVDTGGILTATCQYKPATSQAGDLKAQFISSDTSAFTNATSASIKVQASKRTNTR
jgi:hypothetical protein